MVTEHRDSHSPSEDSPGPEAPPSSTEAESRDAAAPSAEAEGTPPRSGVGDRWFNWIIGFIIVLLTVEMVLLIRQNRQLKAELSNLHDQLAESRRPPRPILEEGAVLSHQEIPTLGGESVALDYNTPAGETVLFIFSPHCPACATNMENWKTLEELYSPERDRLYYVSTSDEGETRPYADENALTGPILMVEPTVAAEVFKVAGIPMTIVVGPEGVVRKVWMGVLEEEAMGELQQYLGT